MSTDKTFVGKIPRGFGRTVAAATMARYTARVTRPYEQEHGADGPALGRYVRRWMDEFSL